jgi:tryptophan synthase
MNAALPDILARVRQYATVPLAVGFGVATREHFEVVADAGADGVVIGSRLVSVIKEAPLDQIANRVREYCQEVSLHGRPEQKRTPSGRTITAPVVNDESQEKPPIPITASESVVLPARFGQFGGQYVPEALVDCLIELEAAHKAAMADPEFWKEFESYFGYMNRPSNLYKAEKLTEHAGGATIWLKREDLCVIVYSFWRWCSDSWQ